MRVPISLVGLCLLWSAPVPALEPVPGTYHYRIRHALFGDIGEHRITVRREDGALIVEHTAELAIELLRVTAFKRQSHYREVWRDDRLVAFEGLTVDNGERFPVSAQAEGEQLMIEGSAGRTLAPAATVPSQPSLANLEGRTSFMDIKTGALLEATVMYAGRVFLDLAGAQVATDEFAIEGELEQQVWYDATGIFAQWRMWRQGAAITLTRDPTPSK